ncbi:hypothetical protein [Streptomyces sp. NPDC048106]
MSPPTCTFIPDWSDQTYAGAAGGGSCPRMLQATLAAWSLADVQYSLRR